MSDRQLRIFEEGKGKYLPVDPDGFRDPYEEAMIRGRVVERRADPDLRVMDEISRKYTGKEFPWRNPQGRVALVIEAEHVSVRKLPFDPPA